MDIHTVFFAFGLTLLAGLATGIGSALASFTRTTNTRFYLWPSVFPPVS
jgi:ZIP family zinc transporter